MRTRLPLVALVFLAVAGAAWWLRADHTPPHYTGFVEGEERVIRSEVVGRVREVLFAEGAHLPPKPSSPARRRRHRTRLASKREELDVAEADIRRQEQQIELSEST